MKSPFICPVCQKRLETEGKSYVCENGHCFDKAKSGYVNLLLSQKPKNKNHGDDKLMIKARHSFLEKGYYEPLRQKLCELAEKYAEKDGLVIDAGCGECYYTAAIANRLKDKGTAVAGADISKDALAIGSRRNKELFCAAASVFSLPFADNSADMLFTVFSPYCEKEYKRVLKPGGIMILAFPLENHLFSLKQAVYDLPYKNEVKDCESLQGFELISLDRLSYEITLPCTEDIENLFSMTPYYYKTGIKDQQKLKRLNSLKTQVEFGVAAYKNLP